MKTLRATLLLVLFISFTVPGFTQDTPPSQTVPVQKNPIWERFSIGGYLGIQFGTVTNLDISPLVIFKVANPFYVGAGFTYLYYKDKRYDPDYSSSGIGGRLLARYFVWRDLFAQVEYDPLNISYYDYYLDNSGLWVRGAKYNTWVHDLLLGAGYRQWLGQRSFATIMVFYNVNETPNSPYSNPIIRIGFGFGL